MTLYEADKWQEMLDYQVSFDQPLLLLIQEERC